jgi:hypothetical protein
MKGYIHLHVNGHFVNYYIDGIGIRLEDFIVNKLVNINDVTYLVKKIEPLIVGPNAVSMTYVYVEE